MSCVGTEKANKNNAFRTGLSLFPKKLDYGKC